MPDYQLMVERGMKNDRSWHLARSGSNIGKLVTTAVTDRQFIGSHWEVIQDGHLRSMEGWTPAAAKGETDGPA